MEEKIYKLTQQIDNDLQYNNLSEEEKDKIAKELKPLLPEDACKIIKTQRKNYVLMVSFQKGENVSL